MLEKRPQEEARRVQANLDRILDDIESIRMIATINAVSRLNRTGLTELEQMEWMRAIREFGCLGMQYLKPKGY
jgi:hypothetical protein